VYLVDSGKDTKALLAKQFVSYNSPEKVGAFLIRKVSFFVKLVSELFGLPLGQNTTKKTLQRLMQGLSV